jgi:TonB family protein
MMKAITIILLMLCDMAVNAQVQKKQPYKKQPYKKTTPTKSVKKTVPTKRIKNVPPPPPPRFPGEKDDAVYTEAEYPGGFGSLTEYLQNNLVYPEKQRELGLEARVKVEFKVGKTGKISNIKIVESGGKAFNTEAMRIVKSLPTFKPATKNGVNIDSYFTLPISFSNTEE